MLMKDEEISVQQNWFRGVKGGRTGVDNINGEFVVFYFFLIFFYCVFLYWLFLVFLPLFMKHLSSSSNTPKSKFRSIPEVQIQINSIEIKFR